MTRQWTQEELEALVYGELDAQRAAELERIAARDEECARELALLRGERELMARRAQRFDAAAGDTNALWSAIAGRIAEADSAPAPAPWWRRLFDGRMQGVGIGVALAGAAAVALLAVATPEGPGNSVATGGESPELAQAADPAPSPGSDGPAVAQDESEGADADELLDEASVALAQAEMSYLQALDALEKAYRAQRESLSPELAQKYDQEFAAARKTIAAAQETRDLHSRRRLLSASSQRVMSLQAAMFDSQEAPR